MDNVRHFTRVVARVLISNLASIMTTLLPRSRAGGLRAGRGEEGVRVLRLSPGECLLKVSTKYRGNFHNQQFLEVNIPIKQDKLSDFRCSKMFKCPVSCMIVSAFSKYCENFAKFS